MTDPAQVLYEQHADSLYAFLLQLARNEPDARDLFQEIFLKVAREPDKFFRLENPRGYLFRIAHNRFLDHCRRREVRDRREDSFAAVNNRIDEKQGDWLWAYPP